MIVYLVIWCEYIESYVSAVFSTREKAENYIKAYMKEDEFYIDEYIVDDKEVNL